MKQRKKFGEILIEAGVLTDKGLKNALTLQKITGKRLGQVLEERKVITERDIAIVLARQFGLKRVTDIADNTIRPETLTLFEADEALKKLIFPIRQEGMTLLLAMVNPLDVPTIDEISFRTGLRVVPMVTTPKEILAAVDHHYQQGEKITLDRKWKILVVEDQPGTRESLVTTLRKTGAQVLEAADGADGLKKVMELRPHLVVCSVLLKKVDGFELLRTLRQNPSTKRIPVIALSYKTTVDEEVRVLGGGFYDFLAKPANPLRLQARSKRALELVYGETP